MLSHCLKCKTDTKCKNPKVSKTSNGRIMLLSKCAVCNSKKSRSIKEQEASRLLSQLRTRTSRSKVQLLGDIMILEYRK